MNQFPADRIVDRAALLVKVINVQRTINCEMLIIRLITTRPRGGFNTESTEKSRTEGTEKDEGRSLKCEVGSLKYEVRSIKREV